MNRRELEMNLQNLFEGCLDEDAFTALEQLLRNSSEARAVYRQYLLLHSSLSFRHSGADLLRVVPMDQVNERLQRRVFHRALLSAVAVIILGMIAMALIMTHKPPPTLTFNVSPQTEFVISHTPHDDKTPTGNSLEPGSRIIVTKGSVELNFASGVRGIVQGPADISLQRDDFLKMSYGMAWFDVSHDAIGFQVATPDLELTDLGTQFGIISKDGHLDQVHVFKGRVHVRSLHGLRKEQDIRAGQARVVDPGGRWNKMPLRANYFMEALPNDPPSAAPEIVANVIVESANGNPHHGPGITPIVGDLLETHATLGGNRQVRPGGTATLLTSGKIETALGGMPQAVFKGGKGDSHDSSFVEFDLDITSNRSGYDIHSLRTIAYWVDQRARQAWTVQFREIGGDYRDLHTLLPTTGEGRVTLIELSEANGNPIATRVSGIRFNFDDAVANWTAYREIDVIGKPSESPKSQR